jgi:lipopolysaccharide export system protein LptA
MRAWFNPLLHNPGITMAMVLLLSAIIHPLSGQERQKIELEEADYIDANQKIVAGAVRVIGHPVRFKHNNVLMWCDSAYWYEGTNRVHAFGNVHINQADTAQLYADKIYYDGNQSFARAINNVRLVNKKTTLYSDTVDYDLIQDLGYYDDNGKIVDSTNVLTSKIAKYYLKEDIVHFYQNVVGKNEKYTLQSDTVTYHTKTGIFDIEGPTTIRDSANTVFGEKGWYNSRTGEAKLLKNPLVYNDKQWMKGDIIDYDRNKGYGKAFGAIELIDRSNNVLVRGKNAWFEEKSETAFITDSAEFVMINDLDSLYLHADTLRAFKDTIPDERIIRAYHGVRFYRKDLQGKCDSLVYFSRDSTVQLFYQPVLWSDIHQMSADYIEMKSRKPAPDEVKLQANAFIISRQDSVKFDQVKGKDMTGYIVNQELNRIFVDGNGQTLYYARDKENIIGLNRAESGKLGIQFRNGKVYRISFLGKPEGKLTPIPQLKDEDRRLTGFDWKAALRPLSRADIFKKPPGEHSPASPTPVNPSSGDKNQKVPAGKEKKSIQ